MTALRPHLLSVVALIVGTAASLISFFISSASVRHSDELLLRQDAVQGSLVLGSFVGQTPPALSELAGTLVGGEVTEASWAKAAGQVAADNGYTALALLQAVDSHFRMVASVGGLHSTLGIALDSAEISALGKGRSPYAGATSRGGKRWLTQLIASTSSPGYAIYSEQAISDKPISLNSLPGHPFSGIDGAVYVGAEAPRDLVYSTTRNLPLTGERAVAVISGSDPLSSKPASVGTKVGSVSSPGGFLLVMRATKHLSGGFSALLPWLLVVVGLSCTLGFAGLLEISERRRSGVQLATRKLEERNLDLDRAINLQQRTAARFSAMVRSSSDLTTVISADGQIRYQSASSATMLGFEADALLGTEFSLLVHQDDEAVWQRALAESEALAGTEVNTEWKLRTSDGTYLTVETRLTNLLDDPSVSGIVLNTRDITDRKRLEDELRHQAFHDSLTGLANRALFEDRLDNALARLGRSRGVLAVIFLDLDDFKAVNDGRGHNVGDALLQEVGERLRGAVRSGDTLARIGGDEFAALIECADPFGARESAQRLMDSLHEPVRVAASETSVRVSIGVVTASSGLEDAQELLRDADIAMYAAKYAGKGRIEFFHPGLHEEVISRLQLEVDLGRALENENLHVHYQALVDLLAERVVGVEALMRWAHPQRGLVMPGEFIPLAESTGLIVPMGEWLLRRACRDVQVIQERTGRPDLHLSVNLSARQLDDPALVDRVRVALDDSGLSPNLLTLEITESVFMNNQARSLDVLARLKGLGVKLSIDDFGTGYSSLGYLHRLPVDELKIDRSFVVAASKGTGNESGSLVETIVRLAADFGLDTVAEGIETEQQLAQVRAAGCHLGQGFLFAKPMELSEVEKAVLNWEHLSGILPSPIPEGSLSGPS